MTRSTRGWLDKLLVWLIAMVVYKPAAAFIYYIGFSYLSSPAASSQGTVGVLLTGIMVLLLAVLALPVLLKFFAWSGTQIGGASGGGSGMLGAVGAVVMSQSYGRGAVDRASAMEANGPGSFATFGTYPPPAGAAPRAGGPTTPNTGAAAGSGAAAGLSAAGAVGTVGVEAVRRTGQTMTGGTDGEPQ